MQRQTRNWKKFQRGLTWAALGTILLGVLGFVADITGVLGYFGINPYSYQPSNEVEAANQVSNCMKQHNLPKAHYFTKSYETNNENLIAVSSFYFCDWTPPPYADPDGYTEIKVETVPGPDYNSDKGMSEIVAPIIDRIYSPCNELKVGYEMGMQGVGGALMPFTATPDTFVDVTGKSWEFSAETQSFGVAGYLGFYPERNELVVIHPTYGFTLDTVECIR